MKKFIVVRYGSNAANQSMQNRKVLGTIEAANYDEAKTKCYERWTCYNNQSFELIDMDRRTKKADREAAWEADNGVEY